MRIRTALRVSWIFLAVLLLCGSGLAYTPRIAPNITGSGAEVLINDRAAVRFKVSNGTLTPGQRATITSDRLRALVAANFDPKSIQAKGNNSQARIYAGQSLVCVVTPADAKADRTNPVALANSWAGNMRRLLALPPVVLSNPSIVVPLGESRRVTVGGAAVGAIYAKPIDPGVASAVVDAAAKTIQVTGHQIGSTCVEVSVEGERAVLNVAVRKYAGLAPTTTFAEVTGSPCPSSLVKYAATHAVLRQATLEPGARIEANVIDGISSALGAGLTRSVKVAVKISGEGFITYASNASVEVHNSIMPAEQPGKLFYSNAPERVLRYQLLFAGKLESGMPTRVLYHHQNAMGKSAHLVVDITNPTLLPATFRVTRAAAGPMVDTVLVGYLASKSFLEDGQINASVIERVPPMSRLVLVSDTLRHLDTSSGIIQVKQTDGSGAYVRVSAFPPGLENVKVGCVSSASDLASDVMSEHIYPSPTKLIEADYIIGQRWAFIAIGRHAIGSQDTQRKLDGNYGVTYDINVKVENPTDAKKKVRVVFDPVAGLASAVFIVDGQMVAIKYTKPPNEFQLASYDMQPGEVRNIRIRTLPVAGSNYPASLVVRS